MVTGYIFTAFLIFLGLAVMRLGVFILKNLKRIKQKLNQS